MSELRWCPPSRDDDVEWTDLLAAMEAVDERGETYELADLDDEWESVWSHPDTDATFVWHGTQLRSSIGRMSWKNSTSTTGTFSVRITVLPVPSFVRSGVVRERSQTE